MAKFHMVVHSVFDVNKVAFKVGGFERVKTGGFRWGLVSRGLLIDETFMIQQYYPATTLTPAEKIKRTANRVGFNLPKMVGENKD